MQDAKQISVKDVMSKAVISVDASLNVNEAAKMMEDAKVGAMIVMENNSPVGIITDRDLAVKIVAHAYPITTSVKKVMSTPLYSIGPDESVWMIAEFMFARGIRKLPVIDNDKVVGIVTSTDLINQLANSTEEDVRKMYFQSVTKIYQQYNPYN